MLEKITYSNPSTELDHPVLLNPELFIQRVGTRCFVLKGTSFDYFAGSAKWYKAQWDRVATFRYIKSFSFEEVFEEVIISRGISDSRKDMIIFHLAELSNLPIHLNYVHDPDIDAWFADEDD